MNSGRHGKGFLSAALTIHMETTLWFCYLTSARGAVLQQQQKTQITNPGTDEQRRNPYAATN